MDISNQLRIIIFMPYLGAQIEYDNGRYNERFKLTMENLNDINEHYKLVLRQPENMTVEEKNQKYNYKNIALIIQYQYSIGIDMPCLELDGQTLIEAGLAVESKWK